MSEEVPTMPQTTHSGARCDSGLQVLSTMWSWNTCRFNFKLNWSPKTSMIHAFALVPPFHMHGSFYMKRSPLVALLSGPMVVQYFAAGSMSNPILFFRKSRKKLRWKYIMFFRAKLDQFWQPASKRGDARRCPDWQIRHSYSVRSMLYRSPKPVPGGLFGKRS